MGNEDVGEGTAMSAYRDSLIGKRVRLVRCTDTYTDLRPGALGIVSDVDDTGTVFVRWESGSNLGLVYDAGDRFEVVTVAAAENHAWSRHEEEQLTMGNEQEDIGEGTVVRDRKWGGTCSGTVVRRDGDSIFVAWHNSFVEDELPAGEVTVWPDAPQALREWRGGVGVWNPAKPAAAWSIEPVRGPEPGL